MSNIDRRTVLGVLAGTMAGACSGGNDKSTQSQSPSVSAFESDSGTEQAITKFFVHGVASGDPLAQSIVLWTRVSTDQPTATVSWQLASDVRFENIAAAGSVETSSRQDYTVKVVAQNLRPGETYYYRFAYESEYSVVGRTRILPVGDVTRLGVALASCSNYPFGYFNAYDAIAKDDKVDVVLHTGDYIYEYAADGWGGEIGQRLDRVHQPAHEIVSLADYRIRHAQYKSDAGSQAMLAAHPLICCWDDHESANNPWKGGAQNHQPEKEGDWQARRAASIQAYYEWMPIRDPQDSASRVEFSRSYQFGNLATLVTLETRHTARAEQIDYAPYYEKLNNQDDAANLKENVIGETGRAMLSATNEQLLRNALGDSVKLHQPWRLIGNASPIARMPVPDVTALGVLDGASDEQRASDGARLLEWKGKYQLPFYTDTWDGYPWARERFYDLCREAGAQDLLFLTGDSHSFWMNQLFDAKQQPMGLELGTAGISSPGDFVESGWDHNTAQLLDETFANELDEVVWTSNFYQGYVRVELNQTDAKASFVAVSNLETPEYQTKIIKQTRIVSDGSTIAYA